MSNQQINKSLIQANSQILNASKNSLKQSVIQAYKHNEFSIMTKATKSQLFFYETVGMFLFVYGSNCYQKNDQADLQVIVSLFLAISMVGYLTGANFNPAVTLSNCFLKQSKYRLSMVLLYFMAQLLGAILSVFVLQLLHDFKPTSLVPPDTTFTTIIRIILGQFMGCFVLIFFILQVSNPNTTFIQNQLSGYFTVSAFVHIARMYAFASGSVINIAIGLALALSCASKGQFDGISWIWLWVIGNFLGTISATYFYIYIYEPIIRNSRMNKLKSNSILSYQQQ